MKKDNMSDKEIRVLGSQSYFPSSENTKQKDNSSPANLHDDKRSVWKYVLSIFAVLAVLACLFFVIYTLRKESSTDGKEVISSEKTINESATGDAYVSVTETVVNDVPIRLFTPTGSKMELLMGSFLENDTSIVLAVQAADIREDIEVLAGAFVYKGEIIAKGHSKYGFCAIINGQVTIGRQRESSLFERAIEEEGDFFRQYSIVSDGLVIDVPPKEKAPRRALCLSDGHFMIAQTVNRESYHDFAQALVDMGVTDALALVGGESLIKYKTADGKTLTEGRPFVTKLKTENYLVWKK